MTLREYFDSVYVPAKRQQGMSAGTLDTLRQSIRWFAASLQREPELSDLNDAALSALWKFIKRHGRAKDTATWNTQRIVSVWRFGWKRGDIPGDKPRVAALRGSHKGIKGRARIPVAGPRQRRIPPVETPQAAVGPLTIETTLLDYLTLFYAAAHDIRPSTIKDGYSPPINSFSRHLGRPAKLSDFNAPTMNAWLAAILGQVSRETAYSYRRLLLVLWRAAYEDGAVPEFPRKIRPIKRPQRIIEGYDVDQMAMLLQAADAQRGSWSNGIERRLWWTAFLLTAWSTGLRLGDLLRIEWDWIKVDADGAGRLSLVMEKTGDAIHRTLPANVVAAIDRLMTSGKPRALCFPLWSCEREYMREYKAVARDAGLPGTTKWIRRGSASEVERITHGAGRVHLGHRSANLFDSAYRVARIVEQQQPLPPEPAFTPTLRLEHTAGKAGVA